jgi:hypothetical protein
MQIKSLVGYTASNKPIYQYDISDPKELSIKIAGFSQEDHFDAVAVFSYLQLVYWRKYGEESPDFKSATNTLFSHEDFITDEFNQKYAIQLGIITSFDRAQYGCKRCVPYLQQILEI